MRHVPLSLLFSENIGLLHLMDKKSSGSGHQGRWFEGSVEQANEDAAHLGPEG
jgi:hypothetical protein